VKKIKSFEKEKKYENNNAMLESLKIYERETQKIANTYITLCLTLILIFFIDIFKYNLI
jgi:hypothetical protein